MVGTSTVLGHADSLVLPTSPQNGTGLCRIQRDRLGVSHAPRIIKSYGQGLKGLQINGGEIIEIFVPSEIVV
jgi:hypothetical protein